MASIIRSNDSLFTAHQGGRAGSAVSALDRLAEARQVTQLSAIVGNGAHDGALQINGHVTDKINNLNCNYLIIPCHCEVVRAIANARETPQLLTGVPVEPRLPAPLKLSAQCNIVGAAELSSLLKKKQNVTIFSKATGKPDTFCLLFPSRVQDNFISLNLVDRLGFETHFDTASGSSIMWVSKRFRSTGDFVDLSFPMPGNANSMKRRFYIVKDCPFDMLLGTFATGSSPPVMPTRHHGRNLTDSIFALAG
ncbi:hypothetical protein IQ06DRAFT_48574 [Phaeosphaeriaceae sp. SRC1lsM3a]|nr:hypothetical protein IQ06DRAFT_48574 [Stagonospora sp. SRC1lsM3a]